MLLGWVSTALFLFFLTRAWSSREPVRFQQILSLEMHAEAITLIGQAAGLCAGLLFGSNDELKVPFGLDGLLTGLQDSPARQVLLNSANLFSLWYVIALGLGVSVLFQI